MLYYDNKEEHGKIIDWKLIFNDMRLAIAPDETVTDEDERHDRLIQIDLIDELMEWMIEQEEKHD